MRHKTLSILAAVIVLLIGGLVNSANAQGRPGGAGPPAGTPQGGGPPAGIPRGGPPASIPTGGGVDRGIGTASQRSGGRSDSGLGTASANSGGRSDTGLDRARMGGNAPSDRELNRYQGIARRFNTTPEVLRDRFLSASLDNPDLTFGQFVAAHVVADNLNSRYPKVSADNILLGLQGGTNLGLTLRNLGVSNSDARNARRTAERQIRESRRRQ
jgi:hypothetical protein